MEHKPSCDYLCVKMPVMQGGTMVWRLSGFCGVARLTRIGRRGGFKLERDKIYAQWERRWSEGLAWFVSMAK